MSLAGPKARPNGVVDGRPVDIPEPGFGVEYVGTRLQFPSRDWLSVFGSEAGKIGKSVFRVRPNSCLSTSGTFGGSEVGMNIVAKSRVGAKI